MDSMTNFHNKVGQVKNGPLLAFPLPLMIYS